MNNKATKKTPHKSIIRTYKNTRKNNKDMSIEFENPLNKIKQTSVFDDVEERKEESQDTEENLNNQINDDTDLKYKDIPEHLLPYLNKLL